MLNTSSLSFQWANVQTHNPLVTTTTVETADSIAQSLPTITSDHVFLSADGERLASFIKRGLDQP